MLYIYLCSSSPSKTVRSAMYTNNSFHKKYYRCMHSKHINYFYIILNAPTVQGHFFITSYNCKTALCMLIVNNYSSHTLVKLYVRIETGNLPILLFQSWLNEQSNCHFHIMEQGLCGKIHL